MRWGHPSMTWCAMRHWLEHNACSRLTSRTIRAVKSTTKRDAHSSGTSRPSVLQVEHGTRILLWSAREDAVASVLVAPSSSHCSTLLYSSSTCKRIFLKIRYLGITLRMFSVLKRVKEIHFRISRWEGEMIVHCMLVVVKRQKRKEETRANCGKQKPWALIFKHKRKKKVGSQSGNPTPIPQKKKEIEEREIMSHTGPLHTHTRKPNHVWRAGVKTKILRTTRKRVCSSSNLRHEFWSLSPEPPERQTWGV